MLLEAVRTDFLEIVFRDNPGGSTGERGVDADEVRPWFMQHEADLVRVNNHDLLHLFMQLHPLGPLEAEYDVFGSEWIAIVKLHALAQREFVNTLVLALRPGFREARSHVISRHRLYQRIMHAVHQPER